MPDLSHLSCFMLYTTHGGSDICPAMRPKVADELVTSKKKGLMFGNGKLVFGDELGLEFEVRENEFDWEVALVLALSTPADYPWRKSIL